jgi:hypothetical protein
VVNDTPLSKNPNEIVSIASMWSYIDHILTHDTTLEKDGTLAVRTKNAGEFVSSLEMITKWVFGIQALRSKISSVIREDITNELATLAGLAQDLSNVFVLLKDDIFKPLFREDKTKDVVWKVSLGKSHHHTVVNSSAALEVDLGYCS